MDIKKYPEVDVRRKTDLFFMVGLILALGATYGAFSYGTRDEVKEDGPVAQVSEEAEEMTDITRQETPPPPPPPPPQTIEVVENDADVQEADIQSTETDETEVIETIVQEQVEVAETTKEPEIFTVVEESPEFPGGEGAMMKYIAENLDYPPLARENNIQGRVVLSFVVNEDGHISDIKVVKDLGYGTAEAAIKVVKSMPRWKPGKQRNKPVKVRFNLPIRYQLS